MRELLNTTDNKLLYLNNKFNIKDDEFFCHNNIVHTKLEDFIKKFSIHKSQIMVILKLLNFGMSLS